MHSDRQNAPTEPSSFLPQTIFVASHRRSGTHLTIDSIRHNIAGVNPSFLTLERLLPSHPQHESLAVFIRQLQMPGVAILKTHEWPELAEFQGDSVLYSFASGLLSRAKVVYAVRDGRDVMVSFYEYRRKVDPTIADVTFSDFLRRPTHNGYLPARSWALSVERWLNQPEVCIAPYELYHADYPAMVRYTARFLGLPTNGNVFDMIMSRNPQAARASSAVLFRRGATEDYKAYFSPADHEFFEQEAGAAMAMYRRAVEHVRSRMDSAN